jgi:hypothetical protein
MGLEGEQSKEKRKTLIFWKSNLEQILVDFTLLFASYS